MSETSTLIQTPTPAAAAPVAMSHGGIAIPHLGTYWAEQGGFLAAILRLDAFHTQYSIAAAPEHDIEDLEWGSYGKAIDGTDSFVDGYANTQALLASDHNTPAAAAVEKLDIAGFSDWYLPAIGELRAAQANVPGLFSAKGWYWSSTQVSAYGAFAQDFEAGGSYRYGEYGELRVRPFRRLIIRSI